RASAGIPRSDHDNAARASDSRRLRRPLATERNAMTTPYPGRLIVEGEHDAALVRTLQEALGQQGYGPFTAGTFDAAMTSAVKLYQAQHADIEGHPLDIDGKVGRATWSAVFGAAPVTPASAPSTLMLLALGIAVTQVGQM